jgi:redox-sensitive bicupin YhaK (pirin superfamily)
VWVIFALMVKIYKYNNLGFADYNWLKARYHFSFANYYNPNKADFGALCVINDDKIAPMTGFPMHHHRDMEIITYIRSGEISHQDNLGNKGITKAGDLQVMSAGTGIHHSEYNLENEECSLYQIWVKPSKIGVKPRWESMSFPKSYIENSLTLLVSGVESDGALFVNQDVKIYGGRMKEGHAIKHGIINQVYILCVEGSVGINDYTMQQGDGATVEGVKNFQISAIADSEILVIDVPSV